MYIIIIIIFIAALKVSELSFMCVVLIIYISRFMRTNVIYYMLERNYDECNRK